MTAGLRSPTEVAIFLDPTSLQYLTGIHFTSGTVAVGPSIRVAYVDGRYEFKARRLLGRLWRVVRPLRGLTSVMEDLRARGIRRIYIDTDTVMASQYRNMQNAAGDIQMMDAAGLSDRLRAVKKPAELKKIRAAVRLTDELWSGVRGRLRIGMTERELAGWIRTQAHRLGAEAMSFEPIIVSGRATAEPHASSSDKEIRGDEPFTVDIGVVVDGYCSDMTRSPFLLHRLASPPRWFTSFRAETMSIQRLAYRMLSAGQRDPKAIVKNIAKRLEKIGMKKYYLHGLGHGVGMKIHEHPMMTEKGRLLKDGMVFTVEPGLYRQGVGGYRVEDMACLWRGRLDVLTQSTKEISWRV